MRLKNLKKIAPLFTLFFVLSTITAPARAFLPLIAEGAMLLAEGSTAANAMAALTVGSVAGVIYLGSKNTGVGSPSGSVLEIPLGTTRERPLATPTGYTPPANNNSQPIPPASGTVIPGGTYWYDAAYAPIALKLLTPEAVCTQVGIARSMTLHYQYPPNSGCYNATNGGPYSIPTVVTTPSTCDVGYTLSGSTCVLSDATKVMKPPDGRCQILASVAGFTIDPNDPECGELAAKTGTTVTPSKISTSTPGSTTKSDITINADGSRTITTTTANADGKTSTITTINLTPAAAGGTATVTGSSVTVVNGTGSAAGTTPMAAAPAIDFPTDYNRELTQQQIKTGIDTLHSDLNADGYTLPAAPALTPEQLVAQENKKITDELAASTASYDNFKMLDWSTWIPVFPTGSCSPINGAVHGKSISIDICPKVQMLNELIGWLFAVFGSWATVSLLFRKD